MDHADSNFLYHHRLFTGCHDCLASQGPQRRAKGFSTDCHNPRRSTFYWPAQQRLYPPRMDRLDQLITLDRLCNRPDLDDYLNALGLNNKQQGFHFERSSGLSTAKDARE